MNSRFWNRPQQRANTKTDRETHQTTQVKAHATATDTRRCPACNNKHFVLFCSIFRRQTPEQRAELVSQHRLCGNCLSSRHTLKDCSSSHRCQRRQGRHHTMLHDCRAATSLQTSTKTTGAKPAEDQRSTDVAVSKSGPNTAANSTKMTDVQSLHVIKTNSSVPVLLATAVINVYYPDDIMITARALIDQGSEATFISEALAQRMYLPRYPVNVTVSGLAATKTASAHTAVQLCIGSRIDASNRYSIKAIVLTRLTSSKLL